MSNLSAKKENKFSKLFDSSELDNYYLFESTLGNDSKAFENSQLKVLFQDELNTIVLNCSSLNDDDQSSVNSIIRKERSKSLSNK